MGVNSCPCCGSALLRHARRKGIYWFCTSCHQEMVPLGAGQPVTCLNVMKPQSALSSSSLRSRPLPSVNS